MSADLVSAERQHLIEQFLYLEAELLDDHRFGDWLGLLAADIRYSLPIRRTVGERESALEYSTDSELAYFDEDKASLVQRVRRLQTGQAWAENPRSRTRHLVSNVRARAADGADVVQVKSGFVCHRNRSERTVDTYFGEREDTLRPVAGGHGFEIVRRIIRLDAATLPSYNLSIFF